MAAQRASDDAIVAILEDSDDDILNTGDASDEEPDGVIQDFRLLEEPSVTSRNSLSTVAICDDVHAGDDDDALDITEDNTEYESTHDQESAGKIPIRVIDTPLVMYGKGKNNRHKWSGIPSSRSRTPRRNILFHPPGSKGPARNVTCTKEVFELFFLDDVINNIVKHTNSEIKIKQEKYKQPESEELENDDGAPRTFRPSFARATTASEIRALIGMYYLLGVFNMNHLSTEEIFDKHSGISLFRATMPRARFEHLTNCLRFDDKETRDIRRETDRLAPIRELYNHIVSVSKDMYTPSDCVTIDEQLIGFYGRCIFKMFIPSKPDKYGIKNILLCDAKTGYMINSIMYLGKDSTPQGMPVADYYVMQLTKSIYDLNRNLTCDNWFTAVPTAKKLLEKGITMVGTLKKNKREIPQLMLETKGRDRNTSMFAFDGPLTLLSYCPQRSVKKKIVPMLSTMHDRPDEDNAALLPEIIAFYNKTKCGVDVFDQLSKKYSTSRKTRRWPLCIFYTLLNTVGVNSWILYSMSTMPEKKPIQKRRQFLKELAMSLMAPYMQERLQWPRLPRDIRESIHGILKIEVDNAEPVLQDTKTGRCCFCPRKKDRKTKTACSSCRRHICAEHQIKICSICNEKLKN